MNDSKPTALLARTVVADDHPLYRAGVKRTLSDTGRFVIVGETGDGETAYAMILEHRPELAVVDVRMPRLDGLSLLARLRKEQVRVPVLMMSAFTDQHLVEYALARGAMAYVDKQAGRDELAAVAVAIIGGGRVLPTPHDALPLVLLPIEKTILSLLRDGWTLRDIPHLIKADRASVERYARDATTRLGVQSPEEAITAAVARGLLEG